MTRARPPVLLFVAALLVGAVVVERTTDPDPAAGPDTGLVDARRAAPVASPSDALGSTWYCAAGSAGDPDSWPVDEEDEAQDAPAEDEAAAAEDDEEAEEDLGPVVAEHTLVLTNPGDAPRHVSVTIHAGTADPVTTDLTLDAGSVEHLELADHTQGPAVAALVEADGGDVVASHVLRGADGVDAGPCASVSSDEWHFAWGDTSRDAREVIALFNPFPGEAVVDLVFVTPDGVREPGDLTGLVVPGRSVVLADVRASVERRDQVAASVIARSGRIVAERVQTFDGSGAEVGPEGETVERTGLTVDLGTPSPHEVTVHQYGRLESGVRQRLVVFNPGDAPAEVDVEVTPYGDTLGGVEPFELTVRPRQYQVVDLDREPRLAEVFVEGAGEHTVLVRSLNGVGVASDLVTFVDGVTSDGGAPLASTELVLPGPAGAEARTTRLRVLNLSADEAAEVVVERLVDGDRRVIEERVLEPAEQASFAVAGLDDPAALVVRATGPVLADLAIRWEEPRDLTVVTAVPALDRSTLIPALG